MKKTLSKLTIIIALTFLCHATWAQAKFSFALGSGAGFSILKKVNGGAYGETKPAQEFKYKPLYWSASSAATWGAHEFGIEFEKQKYMSSKTTQGGVNITMKTKLELDFAYFNTYYKFLIPYEFKKFSPYVKAGLIIAVYTYHEDRSWTDLYGPPGTDFSSNANANFSFSLHVGTNYTINKNVSAFAELGLGPVLCKFGMRYSLNAK